MKQRIAFNYKKAFTLAEVLITLGIIGVVASLTIPTLMKGNQKTQYITGLKKAYSVFNQALKQMTMDNGCTNDLKCTGLFTTTGGPGAKIFGDEIVKYLKVAQNCDLTTDQHCWADTTYTYYDGTGSPTNQNSLGQRYKFTTVDGMSFSIEHSGDSNCTTMYGWQNNLAQVCGWLYVDVNGLKGPNYMGRDVHRFHIANGKGAILYPYGGVDGGSSMWWNGMTKRCIPTSARGDYCAGRIMEESWEMNY